MDDFVVGGFAAVVNEVELEVVADVSLEGEVPCDVLSGFETCEHFVGEGGVFGAVVFDVDVVGFGEEGAFAGEIVFEIEADVVVYCFFVGCGGGV